MRSRKYKFKIRLPDRGPTIEVYIVANSLYDARKLAQEQYHRSTIVSGPTEVPYDL
jgi:hypothetical protein